MSELFLVTIPAALVFLSALLWMSAVAEQRFLSPRSLIVSAARARLTEPEYAEALVAREYERLLRETQRV